MIERVPWLQREFALGLSLSLFPNVLERLRGTPARLEDRMRDIAPSRLTTRVGEAWSIRETIGHLLLVEELWDGRLDDFLTGAETLPLAAYDADRVAAAGFNERAAADILKAFRAARAHHVHRLEGLSRAEVERTAMHPRLNRPVNVLDMMVFAAEHDDHHLAGITEMLSRL